MARETPAFDLLRELVRAVQATAGVAIAIRECVPSAGSHDTNWIAVTGNLNREELGRYESAYAELRRQNPLIDWSKVSEREGSWRRIARFHSESDLEDTGKRPNADPESGITFTMFSKRSNSEIPCIVPMIPLVKRAQVDGASWVDVWQSHHAALKRAASEKYWIDPSVDRIVFTVDDLLGLAGNQN